MVYGATLKERIEELVRRHGRKQVAAWAGRTAAGIDKWLRDGGATDQSLKMLADGAKENYFDIKYGGEWREAAAKELGDDFPVEPVSQADAIQVLDALPPRFRELWVTLGRFMVQRYAPPGPGNPFAGVDLAGRRFHSWKGDSGHGR